MTKNILQLIKKTIIYMNFKSEEITIIINTVYVWDFLCI